MTVPAFKEWAVIVRALLEGEQILDVRKGGLHEDGRRFGVRADRCWLYPTYEHQKPELLKPAYRRWVSDTETASESGTVQISGWADVAGVITITDPDELAAPRFQADLDRGVRGVTPRVEGPTAVVGPRPADLPAGDTMHRSVS